jgi:hypothetical protein
MDNRLNETRRKISFLRSEMLATEDIIRKQINRDEDCTEASIRLMAMSDNHAQPYRRAGQFGRKRAAARCRRTVEGGISCGQQEALERCARPP